MWFFGLVLVFFVGALGVPTMDAPKSLLEPPVLGNDGPRERDCRKRVGELLAVSRYYLPRARVLFGSAFTARMTEPEGALFRGGICQRVSCGEDRSAASCVSVATYIDAGGSLSEGMVSAELLDPANPGAGLVLEYNGGSKCQGSPDGRVRTTRVELRCDATSSTVRVDGVAEVSMCRYVARARSSLACAVPLPGSVDPDILYAAPSTSPSPLPSKGYGEEESAKNAKNSGKSAEITENSSQRRPLPRAVKFEGDAKELGIVLTGIGGCGSGEGASSEASGCASAGGSTVWVEGVWQSARLESVFVGGVECGGARMSGSRVVCELGRGFGRKKDIEVRLVVDGGRSVSVVGKGAVSYDLSFDPFDFDVKKELGVGGLDEPVKELFRRLFATRAVPQEALEAVGGRHVRGALLHGPPGTGKTLLARSLAEALGSSLVRFVAGPEILGKFVGQSEGNVRALFAPAEESWKKLGEKSPVHVVIIDEMDAICAERSEAGADAQPAQRLYDGVVDQLLAKLDGLTSMNNLLLLGLTNRPEVIDPALLRPGRLEVHVHVDYPDESGRRDILEIHTRNMSVAGVLGAGVDLDMLAGATDGFSGADLAGLVRDAAALALRRTYASSPPPPLQVSMTDFQACLPSAAAAPAKRASVSEAVSSRRSVSRLRRRYVSGGFAPLRPLVRAADSAASTAAALWSVPQPRLAYRWHGDSDLDPPSPQWTRALAAAIANGPPFAGGAILLHSSERGTGRSALAVELGIAMSSYAASINQLHETPTPARPALRLISPSQLLRLSPNARASAIHDAFLAASRDAFSSTAPLSSSVLILDDIDAILEAVGAGDAFHTSQPVAHTLRTLLSDIFRPPAADHNPGRLLILATTHREKAIKALGLWDAFHAHIHIPLLSRDATVTALTGYDIQPPQTSSFNLPSTWRAPVANIVRLVQHLKAAAAAKNVLHAAPKGILGGISTDDISTIVTPEALNDAAKTLRVDARYKQDDMQVQQQIITHDDLL